MSRLLRRRLRRDLWRHRWQFLASAIVIALGATRRLDVARIVRERSL